MKTKMILFAVLIAGATMSSCKKDYACVCSAYGFSVEAEIIEDSSKKDAESRCDEIEDAAQQTSSVTTCSIEKK